MSQTTQRDKWIHKSGSTQKLLTNLFAVYIAIIKFLRRKWRNNSIHRCYLGINLTSEVNEPYNKKFKSYQIKVNIKKWKDVLCLEIFFQLNEEMSLFGLLIEMWLRDLLTGSGINQSQQDLLLSKVIQPIRTDKSSPDTTLPESVWIPKTTKF